MDQNDFMVMLGRIDANVQRLLTDGTAQDKRIGSLERSRSFHRGAMWCIGAIGTAITVVFPVIKAIFF